MSAPMDRPGPGRGSGLRVAVVGATGNLGTSVVQALADEPRVSSVLGLSRRVPAWRPPKTTWIATDISHEAEEPRLAALFDGADAVVHLAWLFQPTHNPVVTWRTNVLGAMRVFRATAGAGVPALVHASSVGAYSPGPKDRTVSESWPTHGWPDAAYCREKSYLERVLDTYEQRYPQLRVVRMRPGFLFKRESAAEQRRLFAGPFLPNPLVPERRVPVLPDLPGLRVQALHTDDAAAAIRETVVRQVRGPFNLAAEPVLDARTLAELLGARTVRVPVRALRLALAAAWRAHLVPASPHLFDAVLRLPLLDSGRARAELDWVPEWTASEAVQEFLSGLRTAAGMDTPPLTPRLPRGGRLRELATGVGLRP